MTDEAVRRAAFLATLGIGLIIEGVTCLAIAWVGIDVRTAIMVAGAYVLGCLMMYAWQTASRSSSQASRPDPTNSTGSTGAPRGRSSDSGDPTPTSQPSRLETRLGPVSFRGRPLGSPTSSTYRVDPGVIATTSSPPASPSLTASETRISFRTTPPITSSSGAQSSSSPPSSQPSTSISSRWWVRPKRDGFVGWWHTVTLPADFPDYWRTGGTAVTADCGEVMHPAVSSATFPEDPDYRNAMCWRCSTHRIGLATEWAD